MLITTVLYHYPALAWCHGRTPSFPILLSSFRPATCDTEAHFTVSSFPSPPPSDLPTSTCATCQTKQSMSEEFSLRSKNGRVKCSVHTPAEHFCKLLPEPVKCELLFWRTLYHCRPQSPPIGNIIDRKEGTGSLHIFICTRPR